MNKEEIVKILKDIGLSPAETSVYIALLDGHESVQGITKATNEKRPTIYYSLNSLEKRGLVSKTGKEYGNKFQLEPIDKLLEIIDKNIRKQAELLDKVKKIKQSYPKDKASRKVTVSHFDNMDSIKSAIFLSLYGKHKLIRTIVPGDNFFYQMGQDFIKEYVLEKNKRSISTKALWEDVPSKKIINDFYSDSKIRQLPQDMHGSFKTTIFIYGDSTLYVSSKKECHAVLIQSKEHAEMMTSIFENVWKNGEDVK